jgi:hypothetical protein
MKNIKGVPRKTKYEVLSVEVLGLDLKGMSKYLSADYALSRRVADLVYTKQHLMREVLLKSDMTDLDGMKPYFIEVRVPIINHLRKNRRHKPNDWKERTLATMCKDEMEAYRFATGLIQAHWQKAFKLDRYARR